MQVENENLIMIYKVIGVMSGSSLDGLDIVYAEFTETGGKWAFEIAAADCYPYTDEWKQQLSAATGLSALDYQLLHTRYGLFTGEMINRFISENKLEHKVHLVASHGHTSFHLPVQKTTAQLGDGATIAATVKLPVVSDLRNMDVALGGQGAPIVPIGEKLLFGEYDYFLNIGGIANISIKQAGSLIAFDVCAANRVLNMLAGQKGLFFDAGGQMAASGKINEILLEKLNALGYYQKKSPKSLANNFGTEIVYPLIIDAGLSAEDALCTYVEHICVQIKNAINNSDVNQEKTNKRLLCTGGGALNTYLIERLSASLKDDQTEVIVPDENLIQYKEALIMGLIGVLRWREEINVLSTVTGASQSSVGGALWMGSTE